MSASLPVEVIKKYKGKTELFFETGTSKGDSTQTALEAGYDNIMTIELDPKTHFEAYRRFQGNDFVVCVLGDSVDILSKTVPLLEIPTLFFLDAHLDCGAECTPMVKELEIISKASVEVTILIDDMRLLGLLQWSSVTLETLVSKVKELFPEHEIFFEANAHQHNDLMAIYKESNL